MAITDDKKITVSWDDLGSRKVETRLREQQALARNRSYAQLDAGSVERPEANSGHGLLYNSFVCMTLFGLAGGLLAWAPGLLLQFKPDARAQAAAMLVDIHHIAEARDASKFEEARANLAIEEVREQGRDNPYFNILTDTNLTNDEKQARTARLDDRDRAKQFIADVLAYGICGIMIAVCLAIAEPLTQRNYPAAVINGSVGAMLGLAGGVTVALFIGRLYRAIGIGTGSTGGWADTVLPQVISWGVLGLFLSAAGGVVMRNWKKLLIGMAGGLAGGALGGLLFEPLQQASGSAQASRLAALAAIGVLAGIATALVENVAKTGWLRVIGGLIAGKQFILYRNPTYIGSSPDCEIYLFKDRQVGPRHAAIHLVGGGFELEDLPLGASTQINGKPVARARLRNGDRITIGGSSFLFQEKHPEQKA